MPAKKPTAKTSPLAPSRRWAPPPGQDAEFDEMAERVIQALSASGNPEGITDEQARETLAERMVRHGGKTYETGSAVPDEDGDEPDVRIEPTELRIPTAQTEPYWYEKPGDMRLLDHYVLTRRALGNALEGALLIVGPAGSGKTRGVPLAIARLNQAHNLQMKVMRMDCATVTDTQKWLGRREIDDKGTHFHESDFMKAVRDGWVILLDEITRLHPHLSNFVMPLLDGSQSVHLSDLNYTIAVNPQTVFIATANIGAQFGGTHRFDWALRERFAYTIEREFPPEHEEIKILTSHTGVDEDAASVLVDIAGKTRQMYATGDLRSPISTRTLVSAAWLVASGMREREALEYTALPLYDGSADGVVGEKSERAQVKATIEGRTGR